MPAVADKLDRYRTGRNYIRVGDTVEVSPAPGKHKYLAKVTEIVGEGEIATDVTVYGPRGFRCFRPERIARTRKTMRGDDDE